MSFRRPGGRRKGGFIGGGSPLRQPELVNEFSMICRRPGGRRTGGPAPPDLNDFRAAGEAGGKQFMSSLMISLMISRRPGGRRKNH